MQQDMLSYDAIVSYFGEQTIGDRYKYLYDKMQEYINERGKQDVLYIHEDILHQVVIDYFADIYRLKEFHKITHVNIIKIVSYEVYWLLRRKPIQMKVVPMESKEVFANEGFLTTFIAHECLAPEETEPMNKEQEDAFFKYLKHIYYHLKYRNVDKQNLEIMLYSFETGRFIA